MSFTKLSTASRFSVLKLEGDDDKPKNRPAQLKKPVPSADKIKAQLAKLQAKEAKIDEVKDVNELRSLAFGGKKKKKPMSAVSKPVKPDDKEKARPAKTSRTKVSQTKTAALPNNDPDTMMYEEDLKEALLLSRIDYDEKREVYENSAREAEEAKAGAKRKKQSKKENATMSLVEFNNINSPKSKELVNGHTLANDFIGKKGKNQLQSKPGDGFFEKLNKDVEKELRRESLKQSKKAKEGEVPTDVRILELQDALERVTKQKERLEGELSVLKKMNAKFCSLLTEGKSSNSADMLRQTEENNTVKDELTQEIATLHIALEQERSKNHALQEKLLKHQGHRKD